MTSRFIGGFFALDLRSYRSDLDCSDVWSLPHDPRHCFANARSALAALVRALQPSRVWIPSYICRSVADAVQAAGTDLAYYRVNQMLEPDIDFLSDRTKPGEFVLGVDYFGRAPGRAFRDFAKARSDVVFIEDSVQALDTAVDAWGDWRLFSPRKLIGVADGGFVVPSAVVATTVDFQSISMPDYALLLAPLQRFEDEDDAFNAVWYASNQTREAEMAISDRRMSTMSRVLLSGFEPRDAIVGRKANFVILAEALDDVAFLNERSPSFCPFGFPLRLPPVLRNEVRQALITKDVFPAIHWSDIPSPAADYPACHKLAQELLTLPCDQRYGAAEMTMMAEIVRTVIGAR